MKNAELNLSAPPGRDAASGEREHRPSRLWLWFVAAFVLQGTIWGIWFTIAARHQVAEVPLTTASSGRR